MKLENYTKVRLVNDEYQSEGVSRKDFAYIIEVYEDGYELEFSDAEGNTIAMFAVSLTDVEPISKDELKKK